jgi:hypothetical protein
MGVQAYSVGPLLRMPFRITNSPATYQRLMGDCLADNNIKICYIFIDDIIIFGKAYEEHLEILFLVFQIEGLAQIVTVYA